MGKWGLLLAMAALAPSARAEDNDDLKNAMGVGEKMIQFIQNRQGGVSPGRRAPSAPAALDEKFLRSAQEKVRALVEGQGLYNTVRFAYQFKNPQEVEWAIGLINRFISTNLDQAILDLYTVQSIIKDADAAVNPQTRSQANAKAYSDCLHALGALHDVIVGKSNGREA